MKQKLFSILLAIVGVLSLTTAIFDFVILDKTYSKTETDKIIANVQEMISENKTELEKKITQLEEEYAAKNSQLLGEIQSNKDKIASIEKDYNQKVAELQLANETNASALNDLKKEYLKKVEELISSDTENANRLKELKEEYLDKVADLERIDGENKQAILDLEKEYLKKVEELISSDTENANQLEELKGEYLDKVADLERIDGENKQAILDLEKDYLAKVSYFNEEIEKANQDIENNKKELNKTIDALTLTYESRFTEIDELLDVIQNSNATQMDKIAELVQKITELEKSTRIVDISFGENGDLIVKFADGTSQTVSAPEKPTYTVTFNPNNGESSFTQVVVQGEKAVAPQTVKVPEGYSFDGWYVGENISEKWVFIANEVTQDLALTALFTPNTYEVSYELNGSFNNKDNPTNFNITQLPCSLYEPKKQDCEFLGWYLDSDYTVLVDEITEIGDICLYAKWLEPTLGLTYEVIQGGCEVSGYYGTETIVNIPKTYNGLKVISIGVSAFKSNVLTKIIVPSSVISIGRYAFSNCSGLTEIVIPDSVTSIGEYAFSGCSSLTNVVIDDSATSIGNCAFEKCGSLTNVVIGNGVTTIGYGVFSNCSSLTNVVIPDSVVNIGSGVFKGCNNLVEITVPFVGASRESYGYESMFGWIFGYERENTTGAIFHYKYTYTASSNPWGPTETAYFYCYIPSSLRRVTISGGNRVWFYNCANLTEVVISSSVTKIGSDAFYGCSSLTRVFYNGRAEDWVNITIDSTGNSSLTNATKFYYSESVPTEVGNYWRYDENGEIAVW